MPEPTRRTADTNPVCEAADVLAANTTRVGAPAALQKRRSRRRTILGITIIAFAVMPGALATGHHGCSDAGSDSEHVCEQLVASDQPEPGGPGGAEMPEVAEPVVLPEQQAGDPGGASETPKKEPPKAPESPKEEPPKEEPPKEEPPKEEPPKEEPPKEEPPVEPPPEPPPPPPVEPPPPPAPPAEPPQLVEAAPPPAAPPPTAAPTPTPSPEISPVVVGQPTARPRTDCPFLLRVRAGRRWLVQFDCISVAPTASKRVCRGPWNVRPRTQFRVRLGADGRWHGFHDRYRMRNGVPQLVSRGAFCGPVRVAVTG